MKQNILFILITILFLNNCKEIKKTNIKNNNTEGILDSAVVIKDFRDFKVLDSKFLKNETLWKDINESLIGFNQVNYDALKPLILEQDIPTIQKNIKEGELSYEQLVKFYLYRIRQFDRENELSLNSVIAINPNAIELAKIADAEIKTTAERHPIFGMPILLKDNINTKGMATTAGAIALSNNQTEDAFIVERLKSHGAIILGKANLSEWAYFFCGDCPSGYSAVGGQTLNPYGRRIIDTGGSSSGSGVAVAANFCVAAIGSETSGSILSPASQNSVVGFKPTVGLLSREGIVPISSTLDTAGPITKNVTDNAIVLDAMLGYDKADSKSIKTDSTNGYYFQNYNKKDLQGKRLGAYKRLLKDSLYSNALTVLKAQGATIIEIEEPEIELPDFLRLLNLDMKNDLPEYLKKYANPNLNLSSVSDIIKYNNQDSLLNAPYGQSLFKGVVEDKATNTAFTKIKRTLKFNGRSYFLQPIKKHNLDGFVSINNYHAGYAAVAEYPAITVPMGYSKNGEPKGLTFITKPQKELDLLNWTYAYEQASKARIAPKQYN
ncbi:amidase family protein [Lacinutrix sp. 5H-3-7-4]|uniref:amidase family protein n=1 Tax=Lacinutrix sp. (strain 5H-3-7-4) TaxID=983544 RepID=UPI00020A3917|nr:amidase family protein [Lacinutrix sp. 5H-3-7-4]AEH00017.1 Amidase [Lacinutrix sp. 5H-3-7-4]